MRTRRAVICKPARPDRVSERVNLAKFGIESY